MNAKQIEHKVAERCPLFRDMQFWPRATELDYEGWLSIFLINYKDYHYSLAL
jgi:hypothetical protein